MAVIVEPMSRRDWERVRVVYDESVSSGAAVPEYEAADWPTWDVEHLATCRLVARVDDLVSGWAALRPASRQRAYRGVMDVAVYVAPSARRRGLGRALLNRVILASEQQGVWTLQASVFTDNPASAALYGSCGFRVVGERERIAKVNGCWKDVRLFERRSQASSLATPLPPNLR